MAIPTDRFSSNAGGLSDPAYDAIAITPADADLSVNVRALYVGGAGNVRVKTWAGTTLTFTGVPAGSILPVRCQQVLSTSTTATSIVGLL